MFALNQVFARLSVENYFSDVAPPIGRVARIFRKVFIFEYRSSPQIYIVTIICFVSVFSLISRFHFEIHS